MDDRKRYLVTTQTGRRWKRKLTREEVEQFRQAGFQVEEIEEASSQPNRSDLRRQGLHIGQRRMPNRTSRLKPKRREE